jgi:membrane protein
VLFFAMFRLLAAPDVPKRAMWSGALLGAVGFEILKQVSGLLIRSTQGQPAFQVFGLALILVVWINYFSRVVLYAASWAWTHPLAREQRVVEPAEPVQGPPLPSADELADADDADGRFRKGAFAAGAALGAAAATAVARAGRGDDS